MTIKMIDRTNSGYKKKFNIILTQVDYNILVLPCLDNAPSIVRSNPSQRLVKRLQASPSKCFRFYLKFRVTNILENRNDFIFLSGSVQ